MSKLNLSHTKGFIKVTSALVRIKQQYKDYRAFKSRMMMTLGATFLEWGVKLVFNRKELHNDYGHFGDQREVFVTRLKNAINANTELGAQIESGGHILRDVQPIPQYTAYSVINVFRDAKLNLLADNPREPVSTPTEEWGIYNERWGSPTFHAEQKKKTEAANAE